MVRSFGADRITASVTVTNGTTNGMTFVVNGSTRTWTNNVVLQASQILTNPIALRAKTNLFNHIGLNPFSQIALEDTGTNSFRLISASGVALTASASVGYVSIVMSTQTVATMTAVRVPVSSEAAAQQTNVASGLVAALNLTTTNAIFENSVSVSNLVGRTNVQTLTGRKTFNGGIVASNSVLWHPTNYAPIMTNAINYGNAFRSPGSGSSSEQFGTGATASGLESSAFGSGALATSNSASAFGESAIATELNTTAVGAGSEASKPGASAFGTSAVAAHTNSSAIGAGANTTAASQVRIGQASYYISIPGGLQVEGSISNAHFFGTNQFQAESDIAFVRKAITSLANGNNEFSAGTNVFIEVSGPSGSFTNVGIAGGRDGKIIYVINQTGQTMCFLHESGLASSAANRITTMTASDRFTSGNGAAMLIYSGSASRWLLISLEQ